MSLSSDLNKLIDDKIRASTAKNNEKMANQIKIVVSDTAPIDTTVVWIKPSSS